MKNQKLALLLQVIIFFLILLWAYTVTSKLIDFNSFEKQLIQQNFDPKFTPLLLWGLPFIESLAALLLIAARTRFMGLMLSLLLMLVFTGYVGLVLVGFFKNHPCSCGGIFRYMGWRQHFFFNLFFLFIAGLGCFLERYNKPSLSQA